MTTKPLGEICQVRIYIAHADLRGHPCRRPAFALGNYYGASMPLCRLHHPAEREKRRAARGLTRVEQRIATQARAYKMAALVPELLAACKALVASVHAGDGGFPLAKANAEAAIAKAEKGQQP